MIKSNYAARHLLSSHPDYEELNRIQMMLCYAYNPHLVCHNPDLMDIENLMVPVFIETLKTAQGDLMDDGNFREFLSQYHCS